MQLCMQVKTIVLSDECHKFAQMEDIFLKFILGFCLTQDVPDRPQVGHFCGVLVYMVAI